jgi:NAD(P)-dependent dehydrogenase (short-subunit alcohol dehydrogenase family)
MSDTIVWISGATEGIGSGLAKTVPWPGARIINLSRRDHPDFETVKFDLTRSETYPAVEESFFKELAGFKGERAIFFHNAFYPGPGLFGFVSEVDQEDYSRCIQANAAAPMVLGDMFLRAVEPHYESGLILMSSAAARHPFIGSAVYNAAKAGVEMWVRTVKRELAERGRRTWVTAVRPGFVFSNSTRIGAELPEEQYPVGAQIKKQLETGENLLTPEEAGRQIWSGLPPKNNESVLLFGEMVQSK